MLNQMRSQIGFRFACALLLSFLYLDYSGACQVSQQGQRFYAVSPESHTMRQYSFLSPYRREQGMGTVIRDCQDNAGSFLQVNLGVKQNKPLSTASDIVLDGTMVNDGCVVENAKFSRPRQWQERAERAAQAFKAVQTCFHLDVIELTKQPLQVVPSPLCRLTRLAQHEYRLDGSHCYFKLNARSEFLVTPVMNDVCYDPAFLEFNGIDRQDLDVAVNFWVAGDATGMSRVVDAIGKSEYRFTFEEKKRTEERPIGWSPLWRAETHFGTMKLRNQADGQFVSLGLQVDRGLAETCADPTCSDPSQFTAPVSAEVLVSEVGADGRASNALASWYYGAVAQPRWQGLLEDPLEKWMEPNTLVPGKEYELRYIFRDPREDFELYRSGIPQRLIELKSQMSLIPGLGEWTGIGTLPESSTFADVGQLPSLGLDPSGIEGSLEQARRALEKLAPELPFPPYYDQWCEGASRRCISLARMGSQPLKQIVVRFYLEAHPEVPQLSTVRYRSVEEFDILGNRKSYPNAAMPEYRCTPPETRSTVANPAPPVRSTRPAIRPAPRRR